MLQVKNRFFIFFSILFVCFYTNFVSADVLTKSITNEIESGNISLGGVEGTGASSGFVLDGYIINNTNKELNLDIYLSNAILFVNNGRGQNMYVLGVVERSGRFFRSGKKSFIKLLPKKKVAVKFLSYCANFEKDNPIPGEEFRIDVPTPNIRPVLSRISDYHQKYPNRDITAAAQVAIWITQGESPAAIRSKLEYSQSDLELAYRLAGNIR